MSKRELKRLERCAELAAARGYRLAFSLVGSRHDAEDLVAQALSIATAKAAQIPRNPWPWFAKMITFEARNLRRKVARRGPSVLLDDTPDGEASPLEKALSKELNARLWQAYQGLEEGERETLALVHMAGLSRREAAKQRGVSATSLRRELDGALTKLRAELGVSDKAMLAALPLLYAAPSAAFISSLGTITAAPASGAGFLTSASSIISGGFIMKKYAAAIIIILLLLSGGGAWLVFGGGDSEAPRLASADKKKIEQEGKREGVLEEADLGKERNAEPERVLPIVSEDANDTERALIQDASETKASEEGSQVEDGKPSDFGFTVLVCDESGTYPPVGLPNAVAEWETSAGEKKRAHGDKDGRIFLDLGETRIVVFSAPDRKASRRLFSGPTPKREGFTNEEERIYLRDDIPDNIVQVRCLDASKQPVVGLQVSLLLQGDRIPQTLNQARSDSMGIATLRLYGKKEWEKNMQLEVRWMDKGYSTSPWVSVALPEECFNGPIFELQLPEATRIYGKALRPDGSPAVGAEVGVYNFTQSHPGAFSSLWSADTSTNADGVFSLYCRSADRINAQARWEDEYFKNRENGESEMIDTKGSQSVDVGIIQMEKQLRTRFRATLNGEPVEGAEVEMRNTPSIVGGIRTYSNGEYTAWFWTRSEVLANPKAMEIRFKHRHAYSEWLPIRDKVLNEEVISGELVPITFGTVTFSYSAEVHELSVTAFSERDSHLPRFLHEVADGSGQIQLPVGKWSLRISARARVGDQPDLIAPLEKVTVLEGQNIKLSISLVKMGKLRFLKPAAPEGASLRTSVIYPNKNYTHTEHAEAQNTIVTSILPNVPISLHIRYFRDGQLAEKDIELKPFEAGEEREMDFAKEIAAVIAQIDGE